MTRFELSAHLAALASGAFGEPVSRFSDPTKVTDIPRWESLNYVKLLISIEEAFDVEFGAIDLQDPKTWGGFVDMVQAKIAARG